MGEKEKSRAMQNVESKLMKAIKEVNESDISENNTPLNSPGPANLIGIVPIIQKTVTDTGKSFSEALILASTNPKYDKRLFNELQVQYMKIPSSEHGENMLCT